MSQFISLRVLASLALGQSKEASSGGPPGASSLTAMGAGMGVGERPEPSAAAREEPSSASRISAGGIRVQP